MGEIVITSNMSEIFSLRVQIDHPTRFSKNNFAASCKIHEKEEMIVVVLLNFLFRACELTMNDTLG